MTTVTGNLGGESEDLAPEFFRAKGGNEEERENLGFYKQPKGVNRRDERE